MTTTDTIGALMVALATTLYLLTALINAKRRRDMEALMEVDERLSEESFRGILRTMMLDTDSAVTDIAEEGKKYELLR